MPFCFQVEHEDLGLFHTHKKALPEILISVLGGHCQFLKITASCMYLKLNI